MNIFKYFINAIKYIITNSMSKCSFFILIIAIAIAIIPVYIKFDYIKKLFGEKEIDPNIEDKKKYILSNTNKTMEYEFREKYLNLKNELNNYLNNNTYLQYERIANQKIKELEKEKILFEKFENNIDKLYEKEFKESELKNLTDLIDRYILSEN